MTWRQHCRGELLRVLLLVSFTAKSDLVNGTWGGESWREIRDHCAQHARFSADPSCGVGCDLALRKWRFVVGSSNHGICMVLHLDLFAMVPRLLAILPR